MDRFACFLQAMKILSKRRLLKKAGFFSTLQHPIAFLLSGLYDVRLVRTNNAQFS